MSIVKVNSIQHSGAANASIELNANGRVAFSNTVSFASNVDFTTISSDIELTTLPFFGGTPTINADVTISNTYNFMTPGPVTVANNRTVVVANGATWVVL